MTCRQVASSSGKLLDHHDDSEREEVTRCSLELSHVHPVLRYHLLYHTRQQQCGRHTEAGNSVHNATWSTSPVTHNAAVNGPDGGGVIVTLFSLGSLSIDRLTKVHHRHLLVAVEMVPIHQGADKGTPWRPPCCRTRPTQLGRDSRSADRGKPLLKIHNSFRRLTCCLHNLI